VSDYSLGGVQQSLYAGNRGICHKVLAGIIIVGTVGKEAYSPLGP